MASYRSDSAGINDDGFAGRAKNGILFVSGHASFPGIDAKAGQTALPGPLSVRYPADRNVLCNSTNIVNPASCIPKSGDE